MPTLAALDLTPDAFAPYGEVFDPAPVTFRRDHVALLQNRRGDARPNLFMARAGLATLPHRFDRMEQHPWSSQTFLPCGEGPVLIGVALPDEAGRPDLTTARAFIGSGRGFSYHAGVWHLPVATLGTALTVLGFMYEDGTPQDCVWADVEPSEIAG